MDYGLWTMDYGLWTMDYGLRTTDYGLRTTDYGLRGFYLIGYFVNRYAAKKSKPDGSGFLYSSNQYN